MKNQYFLIELTKGNKKEIYKAVNANEILTCKKCNTQIFNNSEIANSEKSLFDVFEITCKIISKIDLRKKEYKKYPWFSADIVLTF